MRSVIRPARSGAERSGPRARRRGLRLPEWLACSGVALAGYWPWTPGSSAQLVIVAMCLVPLAGRTLLRWVARAQTGDHDRFDRALVGLAILEQDGTGDGAGVGPTVVRANRALREMLGGDPAGRAVGDLVGPDDRAGAAVTLAGLRDGDLTAWHGELCLSRLDDEQPRWLHLRLVPLPRQDGVPARISLQATDVTAHRVEEERLRGLALHDGLTGLPSRQVLVDRLTVALAVALGDGQGSDRGGRRVAVLCCELDRFDRFTAVGDPAGQAAGDAVLVATAQRLRAAIRPGDTVTRLGGDTFVVLCPQVPDQHTARSIAGRLAAAMVQPFDVAGAPRSLSLNIGVALSWPQATAAQLLARADAARDTAERSSRRTGRRGEPVDGASIATSVPVPRRGDDLAITG